MSANPKKVNPVEDEDDEEDYNEEEEEDEDEEGNAPTFKGTIY